MGSHEHHIIPLKTYVGVLAFLLVMTIITVWVSGFDLGALNMPVAMFIATIKAVAVLGYFMHLKYDSNLNRVMIAAGVFFLFIMFLFTYTDIATRITQHSTL